MGNWVNNFYCEIKLNGEGIFYAVADALCEWTLIDSVHVGILL